MIKDDIYYDIKVMYEGGVSVKRIAEILECPLDTVYTVIAELLDGTVVVSAPRPKKTVLQRMIDKLVGRL